jgi:hypothetical protein
LLYFPDIAGLFINLIRQPLEHRSRHRHDTPEDFFRIIANAIIVYLNMSAAYAVIIFERQKTTPQDILTNVYEADKFCYTILI